MMTLTKWYADAFAMGPNDLTAHAVRRLRRDFWLSFLMPVSIGLIAVAVHGFDAIVGWGVNANVLGVLLTVGIFTTLITGAVCAMRLLFSSLINRMWARDRFLDEWELERKRTANSFAFQVLMYSAVVLYALVYFADLFGWLPAVSLDTNGIGLIGVSFILAGTYLQIWGVLRSVVPVEHDDEEDAAVDAAHQARLRTRNRYIWTIFGVSFVAGAVASILT